MRRMTYAEYMRRMTRHGKNDPTWGEWPAEGRMTRRSFEQMKYNPKGSKYWKIEKNSQVFINANSSLSKMATNNFSPANIIGRGGYGTVYKGEWKQLQVAVKRLNTEKEEGRGAVRIRLFWWWLRGGVDKYIWWQPRDERGGFEQMVRTGGIERVRKRE